MRHVLRKGGGHCIFEAFQSEAIIIYNNYNVTLIEDCWTSPTSYCVGYCAGIASDLIRVLVRPYT